MMNRSIAIICAVGIFTAASVAGGADVNPEPAGLVGIQGSAATSWLAVQVDVPDGFALSSLLWYNNDAEVVFPRLLVGTGHEHGPGPVSQGAAAAADFSGGSTSWSQLELAEPIVASEGALYVMFECPSGVAYTSPGLGGGPGFGYLARGLGCPGWVSGDGENWTQLKSDYGFAIAPRFVEATAGMTVKALVPEPEATGGEIVTAYLQAGPNPFNPSIEIRYGLPTTGTVKVDIYDVRGAVVRRLINELQEKGHHTLRWDGRDTKGRGVASGVYLVKLTTPGAPMVQRVTLLR